MAANCLQRRAVNLIRCPETPQARCSGMRRHGVLDGGRPAQLGRRQGQLVLQVLIHAGAEGQPSRIGGCVASTQPDTEEQRSPLDAPQEWEAPAPSRRPDIFPEFEKLDRVVLPKPLPGDPEVPDEEADESQKRTEPGDPDPEAKPGEPSEPEPGAPGSEPEPGGPSVPTIPE